MVTRKSSAQLSSIASELCEHFSDDKQRCNVKDVGEYSSCSIGNIEKCEFFRPPKRPKCSIHVNNGATNDVKCCNQNKSRVVNPVSRCQPNDSVNFSQLLSTSEIEPSVCCTDLYRKYEHHPSSLKLPSTSTFNSSTLSCNLGYLFTRSRMPSSISKFFLLFTLLLSNFFLVSIEASSYSQNKYGSATPYGMWERSLVLDDLGYYMVEWTASLTDIQFRLTARTRGYIGFGLSSQAKMHEADIVVGWVHSGKAYLQDRHGLGNLEPAVDRNQDWTIVSGYENDTHTVLHVSRPLDTCDLKNDYVITNDTARILWAYHPDDPVDPDSPRPRLHYHGDFRRGARSVFLLDRDPEKKKGKEANYRNKQESSEDPPTHTWTLTSPGVEVKSENETVYWCKLFRKPLLVQKNHIIKFTPVFSAGNERHVHHMTVYECASDKPGIMTALEQLADSSGDNCHSPQIGALLTACSYVVVAWAVGSQGLTLPPEAGYPLAPNGPAIYLMQIHYDNPDKRHFKDYSGMRVHYTHVLRSYDAGVLSVGLEPNWKHLIPPKQSSVLSSGHCVAECTANAIPAAGVKVFGAVTQTHLLGREIKLRHIRRGQELDPIAQDKNYDFNYLEYRMLKEPKTVLPGDHLISECRYSSMDRSAITLGGLNTRDEMCLSYLYYYPRVSLSACHSKPSLHTVLQSLGIQELSHDSDIIKIIKPVELAGKTLEWRLVNYDWQYQFEYFQTTTHTGTFNPMCRARGESVVPVLEQLDYEYPNISEPWTPEDTCRRPQWPLSKDGPHHRRQRPHHRRQQQQHLGEGLQDEAEFPDHLNDNSDVMFDDDINSKPIKRIDADPVRKFDVFMPVMEDFLETKNHGMNNRPGGYQGPIGNGVGSNNDGGYSTRGNSGRTVNTRNRSPYETLREEFDEMEHDLEREVNHHREYSSSQRERTAHKTRTSSAPRLAPSAIYWSVFLALLFLLNKQYCSNNHCL